MQTVSATVRNAIELGRDARRLADALRLHLPDIADRQRHAALHRVEVAARDFALAIGHAEAALSPSAKAAIDTV